MKVKHSFFKQVISLLVVSFAITAPTLLNAKESAEDGLQRCGLIGDNSSRLVCYDQLGGRKNSTVASVIEPAALPADDLFIESLTDRNDKQTDPSSGIVKVTKCSKSGGNKKFIFYLEDGQVWKQISDKRLYFKDCDFGVSIRKDFFGYKMQREGSDKEFRVSRIR